MKTSNDNSSPKFVVIGYGDPNHGDDSIGSRVVAQLKTLHIPNLKVDSVGRLTPELSSKLAVVDVAIFVDACRFNETNELVHITSLDACGTETTGSSVPGLGHSCDPCSLLALTCSVYGHFPKAWWVKVPAYDFMEGHQRSAIAEHGIDQAVQAIQALIKSTE